MSETRRLAAILAVDVVGYSRLMGEDEAGTLRAVREHRETVRPIVREKGGRIVKTMGDGLLLEFPSVVAATECAIAIQALMLARNEGVPEAKRIAYRIGVHLGDVLVEDDDIFGEGVNIAARLESMSEAGGVCLSEDAHRQVRGRVRAEFVDLGEQALKNIARPVRVFGLNPEAIQAAETSSASPAQTRAAPAPRTEPAPAKLSPARLSMVVLPFANIGGGPEQEYFVDGVTESLTTDLSRIAGAFVIARNTAFTYKGKAADVKQVGRELNVRYVLEGSVQRAGVRMRVNMQLIEAESGAHLWAERFDKPVADLFDMQDEIVARLANQLQATLAAVEAQRTERAVDPDSMDHYFRGLAAQYKGLTLPFLDEARGHFDHALESDPRNIDALARRGGVDALIAANWLSADRAARLTSAEAILRRALALNSDHAFSHAAMGIVYIYTRRAEQGLAECEHALALDRNLAWGHGLIGYAKHAMGRNEEVEGHIAEAMRLSPRDPDARSFAAVVGIAMMALGRDAEGSNWLTRAIKISANYPAAQFLLGAALANLGRLDEAREAVRLGLELNPTFSLARFRAAAFSDNPIYLAGRERMYEGMRKAGVPEG